MHTSSPCACMYVLYSSAEVRHVNELINALLLLRILGIEYGTPLGRNSRSILRVLSGEPLNMKLTFRCPTPRVYWFPHFWQVGAIPRFRQKKTIT